jgi:hypothetical protein
VQASFEQLVPLLLLAFGGKGGSPGGGSFPASTPPTGMTTSIEVPRIKTGGDNQTEWARSRYQMLLGMIRASGYVFDDALAAEIALSLLAQWAHETGRGSAEFNYNLGGWRARKGDTYFTARDVQTPGSAIYRWTAYPDLQTGMADQVMRLVKTFPSAAKLLLDEPKSSRWVEELGRKAYARAWAMNRAELKAKVQ